jgi:uncharacterized glyoxalase superfamily protein PhnB
LINNKDVVNNNNNNSVKSLKTASNSKKTEKEKMNVNNLNKKMMHTNLNLNNETLMNNEKLNKNIEKKMLFSASVSTLNDLDVEALHEKKKNIKNSKLLLSKTFADIEKKNKQNNIF